MTLVIKTRNNETERMNTVISAGYNYSKDLSTITSLGLKLKEIGFKDVLICETNDKKIIRRL